MNAQEALYDLLQTLYIEDSIGLTLCTYIESRLEIIQPVVDKATPKVPAVLFQCIDDAICDCGAYLKKEYKCCPYCQQAIDWVNENK